MQAGAQVVPRLTVELAPVGEDEVLQAGNSRPGELLVVLLDAPLQLGKEVVQEERGDDGKILKGENYSSHLLDSSFEMEMQENTWSILRINLNWTTCEKTSVRA